VGVVGVMKFESSSSSSRCICSDGCSSGCSSICSSCVSIVRVML